MRHGQKGPGGTPEEDALTDKGKGQVRASAKANLKNVHFDVALFSGQHRALQTVEIVLNAIGQNLPVRKELGFGFQWAMDDRWPINKKTGSTDEIDKAKAAGEAETADLWRCHWPSAQAIWGRVMATLLLRGILIARDHPGKAEINVLVGSHSPTAEMAAIDLKSTPRLGVADIIVYTVKVDAMADEAEIVSSEVLKAPAEAPAPAPTPTKA